MGKKLMLVQLIPEGYLQLFHFLHANRVRNSVNDAYDQQLYVHCSESKKNMDHKISGAVKMSLWVKCLLCMYL